MADLFLLTLGVDAEITVEVNDMNGLGRADQLRMLGIYGAHGYQKFFCLLDRRPGIFNVPWENGWTLLISGDGYTLRPWIVSICYKDIYG